MPSWLRGALRRVGRCLAAVWRFLDRIGWVIAIAFVLIAILKVHQDEQGD